MATRRGRLLQRLVGRRCSLQRLCFHSDGFARCSAGREKRHGLADPSTLRNLARLTICRKFAT